MAKKAGLGGAFLTSRVAAQIALATLIAKKLGVKFAALAAVKRLAKLGVGAVVSVILIQGIIERASNASKRLQKSHPDIYKELKAQNLDMAFFLVEEYMEPVLTGIKLYNTNKKQFNGILNKLQDKYLD